MDEVKSPKPPPKQEQLSGVAVVIIIGIGVQTFIMLFIFAKRQIMRFTLRGRRGPHVSVGQGGMKFLRKEIDRRIEYAAHIKHVPRIHCHDEFDVTSDPNLRFRVQAVDSVGELDSLLAQYDPELWRPAGANLRSFLIECLAGPLVGIEPKKIHTFCDLFDHARHSYKPFLADELGSFNTSLNHLKQQVVDNTRNKPASSKKGIAIHRRALNRPRRRIVTDGQSHLPDEGSQTVVVRLNSSTVVTTNNTNPNSTSV